MDLCLKEIALSAAFLIAGFKRKTRAAVAKTRQNNDQFYRI